MERQTAKTLVSILLVTFLGTFFSAYVAFLILQNETPTSPLSIWNRWDGPHYLTVAANGYRNVDQPRFMIVRLPVYPILIRLLQFTGLNPPTVALVVANLAYAIAAIYLFRLTSLDYPPAAALKSVLYMSIFPTAYFLHAGYTESTFLALTIAAFYYARRGKWFTAGILGAVSSATRITGCLLLPALLVEYLDQSRLAKTKIKKDILYLALMPLGLVFFLATNYVIFRNPFQFISSLGEYWNTSLAPPWRGFLNTWNSMPIRPPSERIMVGYFEVLFAVVGLGASILCFIKVRRSYGVYMMLVWLVITSLSFWLSIPRYTLTMFPLFILLALASRRPEWSYPLVFSSLLLYGTFLSNFVRGRWAF